MNPRFPIYIPSKGRWQHERRLTARALEKMGVPYFIVIEESEAPYYAPVVGPLGTILILPSVYQENYDTCDDLGGSKPRGSGPARNYIWDHAVQSGAEYHWIMDDNIHAFYRLNRNTKYQVHSGVFFRVMEDFVLRYENVLMAGPHYESFVPRRIARPPFTLNTRIYSCNLIRNDAPYRWRGRYNEDTILSLDMLKDGWCTVLFNALLQNKVATQRVRGGNTDTVYVGGTLPKSRMIADVHPDVARVVWRFNRWHHHVDYRLFRGNRLRLRPGVEIPEGVDEYGMALMEVGP